MEENIPWDVSEAGLENNPEDDEEGLDDNPYDSAGFGNVVNDEVGAD